MIETDIIYAYVKTEDWLKNIAEKLIRRISKGEFGTVYASREVFHEMYYVSQQEGVSIDEYISRVAALTAIENIVFLETTSEIDLLALILMKQYRFKSIFDAYYAATALNQVPDHSIVSTDTVFDNVAGIKRIDPREI
ncbi:MAG: PIN domain-containing protein [Thermoproteota archaeon]